MFFTEISGSTDDPLLIQQIEKDQPHRFYYSGLTQRVCGYELTVCLAQ